MHIYILLVFQIRFLKFQIQIPYLEPYYQHHLLFQATLILLQWQLAAIYSPDPQSDILLHGTR